MKKALYGVFGIVVILIFILIWFTIDGRAIRQTELDNALTISMENAMDMLLLDEGRPLNEEEWISMFLESLVVQIESSSDLILTIVDCDMEKGLLSVEATLGYTHIIGTRGNVSAFRTVILEQYILDE